MAKPQKVRGLDRSIEAPFNASSTTITFVEGDLCYQSSDGNVLPMGSVTITTSFVGVAAQAKAAALATVYGNSTPGLIRLDTDGEYDYDCDDTVTMTVGTRVGPDSSSTKVKKVGDGTATYDSISLGCVTKQVVGASGGRVRIKINSSIVPAAKAS